MPYQPSPAIPPGMDPRAWQTAIDSLADETARLASRLHAGQPIPAGMVARVRSLQTTAAALRRLAPMGKDKDKAIVAAYGVAGMLSPLYNSGTELRKALGPHAIAAADELSGWAAKRGFSAVADVDALHALTARSTVALTHDWERLTAATTDRIVRSVGAGMVGGLNPREVASRIEGAMTDAGAMTWARGMLIAQTEMADLYDASRLNLMSSNTDVFGGWWWRARPDACPICQIKHGMVHEAGEPSLRHHRCRCVQVPIIGQPPAAPGDYMPGMQRDPDRIKGMLPKKVRDSLPDGADLRGVLGVGGNKGWRDSLRLRPYKEGRALPHSPDAPPPLPKDAWGAPPKGFQPYGRTQRSGTQFAWDAQHVEDLTVRLNARPDGGQVLSMKVRGDVVTDIAGRAKGAPTPPLDVIQRGLDGVDSMLAANFRMTRQAMGDAAFDLEKWLTTNAGVINFAGVRTQVDDLLRKARAALPPPPPGGWRIVDGNRARMGIPGQGNIDADTLVAGRGRTLEWDAGDGILVRYVDAPDQWTYSNTVQVWVPPGVDPKDALDRLARELGITSGHPQLVDVERYTRNRLAIMLDSQAKDAARRGVLTDEAVEAALGRIHSRWGVGPEDITWRTDPWGQSIPMLPDAVARRMAEEVRENVWKYQYRQQVPIGDLGDPGELVFTHSLSSTRWLADALADLDQPLALNSTHRRFSDDIGVGGMSSGADVETGGAEYVFTRPRLPGDIGFQYSEGFVLRNLHQRADWYAYDYDSYGATNPGNYNYRDVDNFDMLSRGASSGNNSAEVMFKGRVEAQEGSLRLTDHTVADILRSLSSSGRLTPEVLDRLRYYVRRAPNGDELDWDALVARLTAPPPPPVAPVAAATTKDEVVAWWSQQTYQHNPALGIKNAAKQGVIHPGFQKYIVEMIKDAAVVGMDPLEWAGDMQAILTGSMSYADKKSAFSLADFDPADFGL